MNYIEIVNRIDANVSTSISHYVYCTTLIQMTYQGFRKLILSTAYNVIEFCYDCCTYEEYNAKVQ